MFINWARGHYCQIPKICIDDQTSELRQKGPCFCKGSMEVVGAITSKPVSDKNNTSATGSVVRLDDGQVFTLYVSNLSKKTREKDLLNLFRKYNPVQLCILNSNR